MPAAAACLPESLSLGGRGVSEGAFGCSTGLFPSSFAAAPASCVVGRAREMKAQEGQLEVSFGYDVPIEQTCSKRAACMY